MHDPPKHRCSFSEKSILTNAGLSNEDFGGITNDDTSTIGAGSGD